MKNIKVWYGLVLSLTILPLCVYGQSNPTQHSYPIQVEATVGMIGDLAKRIGGEHLTVGVIMGQGIDPHTYKASPGDVARLLKAEIVFYNGLMLEGKMADVFKKVAISKPVFAVGENIDDSLLIHPAAFKGHPDPHIWMDVSMWKKVAQVIEKKLSEYDPANQADYQKNLLALVRELDLLDRYARQIITSIPTNYRVLVTAHDAFNYFGRAYNVEVRGIQGISTESEAGLKDINDLVDFLVNRKIKAVFVESSVSPKNVEALIEGCKAREHNIKIGGTLYSDAMGAPGTTDGTYLGMIEHNINTIVEALGGQVPKGGFETFKIKNLVEQGIDESNT